MASPITRITLPKKSTAPVAHPTLMDIAWAAGIYEGEGTVSAVRGYPRLEVSQKDPELLYRLRDLFGGKVRPDRVYFKWTLSGARARGFLLTIFPFLTARRKRQIATVFAAWLALGFNDKQQQGMNDA